MDGIDPLLSQTGDDIAALIEDWKNSTSRKFVAATFTMPIAFEAGVAKESAVLRQTPAIIVAGTLLDLGNTTDDGQLVLALRDNWHAIIEAMARDPDLLHSIDSRVMEEIVAGAYLRSGWNDVQITPRSGDGGVDVYATWTNGVRVRVIDQVKRYGDDRRVDANDVRALFGVLADKPNISKGFLTTSARLAPGVRAEFANRFPYRIDFREGPELREWLFSAAGVTPKAVP